MILVIGGDVETKMAPFDENLECESKIYKTREEVAEEMKYVAERLLEPGQKDAKYLDAYRGGNLEKMSVAEFAEGWWGMEVDDEGNVLTTQNEHSKWDWWVIGGRWRGSLLLKPGVESEVACLGDADSFGSAPEYPDGVDQALVREIDWERMQNDPEKKRRLEQHWDTGIEGKGLFKPEYFLELFGTQEEYVRRHMRFMTRAVIDQDGEWHEAGAMGWFGFSSETADEKKEWDENFWDRFIAKLSPDTQLTIVDAHI